MIKDIVIRGGKRFYFLIFKQNKSLDFQGFTKKNK
jgi:hypothetical protein